MGFFLPSVIKAVLARFFVPGLPVSPGLHSQWREHLACPVFLDVVDQFKQLAEASTREAAVVLEPFQVCERQFMDGQSPGRIFVRSIFTEWHMGIANLRHGLGELFRINHRF